VLRLFFLSTLGLTLPLFDVLSRSPEFLVPYALGRGQVVALVLAVFWGLPLILALLGGLGRPGMRVWTRRGISVLLWAAVVLPILNRIGPGLGWGTVPVAVLVGAFATRLLENARELRAMASALGALAILAPAYVLLFTPLSALVLAPPPPEVPPGAPGVTAPVVMVVFDEFPMASLLDANFEIDGMRYSHFARLARDGVWFRNATTVASVTQAAVAAILTGNYPALDPLAVDENRTRNVFSLLSASHRLNVHESYLHFCHETLCPTDSGASPAVVGTLVRDLGIVLLHVLLPEDLRERLPLVTYPFLLVGPGSQGVRLPPEINLLAVRAAEAHRKERAGIRAAAFESFIESIQASERPGLHYLHILLPHEPSVYLPDGTICLPETITEPMSWGRNRAVSEHAHLRHLLQLEYVDRLLGRLLERLTVMGTYDSSLIVVVADHGVSYRAGAPRRAITAKNMCDIVAVPLFIKPPGHVARRESGRRNVEVVDVLPTIADLLDIDIPWPVAGRSAFDDDVPERPSKTVVGPYWFGLEAKFFSAGDRAMLAPTLPRECFGVPETLELRRRAARGTGRAGGVRPGAVPECDDPAPHRVQG